MLTPHNYITLAVVIYAIACIYTTALYFSQPLEKGLYKGTLIYQIYWESFMQARDWKLMGLAVVVFLNTFITLPLGLFTK